MKPIELALSGLQSYREEQRIDFRTLSENGIFGIFGPTGSGKSTILDAITLALYGKVERATNGTQGIMNQAEDQLSVSFAFQLNGVQSSRMFRVERRFKRTGEATVSNTVSRFIEITSDSETVLADKLADVTRMVEYHIGLKMDDFTRAVVLPQGKFAEFLSLKGSDRRQMLQRLFSLEQYGDELASKLSRRLKATEAEVNSCAAEQQGLGDASAEALTSVESELTAAAAVAEAARAAKEAAALQYQKLAEQRDRQADRVSIANQLAQLEQQADAVTTHELQLKRSAEAELLAPYAQEAGQSQLQLLQDEAKLKQTELAAAASEEECKAAEHAANKALLAREQQEPVLLHRIEQLKQAAEWHEELVRLRQDAERTQLVLAQAQETTKKSGVEIERFTQLIDKAGTRQAELKQQLKTLDRPLAEREAFQLAWLSKERLVELQANAAQLEALNQLQANAVNTIEQEIGQEVLNIVEWGHPVPAWRQSVSWKERQWKDNGKRLLLLTDRLNGLSAWAAQHVQHRTKSLLAAELASSLTTGEPCPVCGSVDHTSNRAHVDPTPDIESYRVQRAAGEQLLEQCQQLREQVKSLLTESTVSSERCVILRQELRERLADVGSKTAALLGDKLAEQIAAGLENSNSDDTVTGGEFDNTSGIHPDAAVTVEKVKRACVILESEWASEMTTVAAGQQQYEEMSEQIEMIGTLHDQLTSELESSVGLKDSLIRQLDAHLWQLQQLSSKRESARAVHAETKVQLSVLFSRVSELSRVYEENYSQWPYEQLDELRAQWLLRDQEAEDCRQRIDRSVTYLEETQAQYRVCDLQHRQAEIQVIQSNAELQSVVRIMEDLDKRVEPWLVPGPITDQVIQAERRLTDIRANAVQLTATVEAARLAEANAKEQLALARQAYRSAVERAEQAAAKLQLQLDKTGFATAAEAEASLLPMQQRDDLQQQVKQYHERCQDLSNQLRRLDEQLQGIQISEEDWQACVETWELAQQQDEAALSSRAKAERDVEQLRSKHSRWMALEQRRSEGQSLLSRLQQLQTVFRGNAFVEYVAEEQLLQVSRAASERLKVLTKQRYSLEVDSGGGFVIRDDANGGIRRPVSTLSGGETFLTSLALALALSAQIQLRGMYPLEFFFLDEGFGTLDPELLDTVVTALEKLHTDRLSVGVISHVPELRARLPRKLVVQPAEQAGRGSRIMLESM
ncbi:SMC family ATPase [Paenibacillus sp. ACRRX]|uniref:AAA family ATPase n=1 Tax=Paenibacillus sp. ACRRX TaxID=2918206 RepID=UPI001EF4563C|nr:SMC family ATPase [Paenibacillus sp. ACRRX]MCG7407857.1 SMC family ATPase [Paenibacillus sp. ACRRX]